MDGLTGRQRDFLHVASVMEGASGEELACIIGEYYEQEFFNGHIYNNLGSLVEEGFLDRKECPDRENENTYFLTPEGKKELHRRRRWEDELLGEGFFD